MKYAFVMIALLLSSVSGLAYVENVTHGYPSCIACHHSPAGGNLLTDYGRSLSKELMSTWGGWKNSEQPLFGAVPTTDKIVLGGDLRYIQSNVKSKDGGLNQGKSFLMQQNFEVGIPYGKVMLVGTLGTQEGPDGTPGRHDFLSERHYLLWTASPTSRIRIGKFRQRFGLNDPNHRRVTEKGLGFGSLTETYNLEYTQFYETYEVSLNASLGRIDRPRQDSERNISGTYVNYLGGKSRLGTSFLFGESQAQRRWIAGAFGVIPITEHSLALFEADYQRATLATAVNNPVDTFVGQMRLAYKPFKGLLTYLLLEAQSEDSNTTNSFTHAPGVGIQWFPFPHVEVHMEYQRAVNSAQQSNPVDIAWVQLHLYPF